PRSPLFPYTTLFRSNRPENPEAGRPGIRGAALPCREVESAAEAVVASLAALLYRCHRGSHLLGTVDTLAGNDKQIGHGLAVIRYGLLPGIRLLPDVSEGRIALPGVAGLGKVVPGRLDQFGQALGVSGQGLAIEGHAPRQHAAHGLAVLEELFEHRLTLALRRIGIGRTAATDQSQAQGRRQQYSGKGNRQRISP